MIEEDTIKLLRECDSGSKMGISSIEDVLMYVNSETLKQHLLNSKKEHESINTRIQELLDNYQDEGKNPNLIIQGMSKVKTKMELIMNESDCKIADLMTDGCNMGIKTLNKYLNEYEAADEKSKNLTKELIAVEEKLLKNIRPYL